MTSWPTPAGDPEDGPPTYWLQRSDGSIAPVYDGWVGPDQKVDASSLSESDYPPAVVAAVLYIDPLDVYDHTLDAARFGAQTSDDTGA